MSYSCLLSPPLSKLGYVFLKCTSQEVPCLLSPQLQHDFKSCLQKSINFSPAKPPSHIATAYFLK